MLLKWLAKQIVTSAFVEFNINVVLNRHQVEGPGENMGLESYLWKKLVDRASFSQQIQCTNTKGRSDIFINVDGRKEEIFLERTGSLTRFAVNFINVKRVRFLYERYFSSFF